MPFNRTLLRYCGHSLNDRRIWISASMSAVLWFIPMFALDYFASGRTSDGWRSYWERLPLGSVIGFVMMLSIALLMHLLFRERVQRLSGKSFWLFPITSITVAALIFSSVAVLGAISQEWRTSRIELRWIMIPIYYLSGAVFVAFYYIWVTYPLAIINQIIVRKVFETKKANKTSMPTGINPTTTNPNALP